MSFLQIPALIDHQLYLSIQYLITLLNAEAASARKQADTWRDLRLKYDPHQPRVPSGRSNGGEWTEGGGGGRVSAPLPRRSPLQRGRPADNWWDDRRSRIPAPAQPPRNLPPDLRDSMKPLYPKPSAGRYLSDGLQDYATVENVVMTVAAVAAPEAVAVGRILSGIPAARIFFSGIQQQQRVLKAAREIEKFLGGKADIVILKETGDFVLIKGNIQIRFDLFKYGASKNARPHFQIQRKVPGVRKETWEDLGQHWYDFLDSRSFIKKELT